MIALYAAVEPAVTQKRCAWCFVVTRPGSQPETYGICPRCAIRVLAEADQKYHPKKHV